MKRIRERLAGERPEAGETLIEILMSTALIAIVVVGILGALATTVLGSKVHRDHADANTTLVAVLEHLKSSEVARVACADATEYQDEAVAARDDAEAAIPAAERSQVSYTIEHQTIVSGALQWVPPSGCVDDGVNTLTLQRISLALTAHDGSVSPTLSFIKGDY